MTNPTTQRQKTGPETSPEPLEAERNRLHAAYIAADDALHAAVIASAEFKVGDVLMADWHRKQKRGIIRSVHATWSGIKYRVAFIRADGEWGTQSHLIYGAVVAAAQVPVVDEPGVKT